jgi:hypothetical protein
MADPHVVSTLRAKREEIERSIAYLESKLTEARVVLSHVNAVLRLYELGPDPHLPFPAHMDLNRLFRRGELVSLAKQALSASGQPMTTREIALAVVDAKGWDTQDKVLRSAVAYRLVQALTMQAKRGKLASPGKRGNVRVWQILE